MRLQNTYYVSQASFNRNLEYGEEYQKRTTIPVLQCKNVHVQIDPEPASPCAFGMDDQWSNKENNSKLPSTIYTNFVHLKMWQRADREVVEGRILESCGRVVYTHAKLPFYGEKYRKYSSEWSFGLSTMLTERWLYAEPDDRASLIY